MERRPQSWLGSLAYRNRLSPESQEGNVVGENELKEIEDRANAATPGPKGGAA